MTQEWISFIETVNKAILKIERTGSEIVYFRGHSSNKYELLPTLFRKELVKKVSPAFIESIVYYDFITNASELIKVNNKSWDILYLMRHHGFPTRLLDWTENFATALYFALESGKLNNPEIWILDAHELNKKNEDIGEYLINPELDLDYDYYEAFIAETAKTFELPLAIYPGRNNIRLSAQRGLFTVHGSKRESLYKLAPDCVIRIPIPQKAVNDARKFLRLAGINEFSIFRDLDSLSRFFKKMHKY